MRLVWNVVFFILFDDLFQEEIQIGGVFVWIILKIRSFDNLILNN